MTTRGFTTNDMSTTAVLIDRGIRVAAAAGTGAVDKKLATFTRQLDTEPFSSALAALRRDVAAFVSDRHMP